jgi:hypothetical protein
MWIEGWSDYFKEKIKNQRNKRFRRLRRRKYKEESAQVHHHRKVKGSYLPFKQKIWVSHQNHVFQAIQVLEVPRWHTDSVTGMLQVFFTGMVFAGDVRKKVSCNSHAIHSMHYIAVAGLIFILKWKKKWLSSGSNHWPFESHSSSLTITPHRLIVLSK